MLATVVRDNGVAGGVQDEMEITQSTPQTLSVQVGSGGALLGDPEDQLYWYDNPTAFTFDDFTTPHASQARIDLLGILLDTSDPADLYGGVQVITGTPAGSPQRPSHNHGDNFVELAQIRIPGGASRIVNGNITDTRAYIERTTFQQLRDSLIFTGIARRTVDSARNQITVNVPATSIPDPPSIPDAEVITSTVNQGAVNLAGRASATLSSNFQATDIIIFFGIPTLGGATPAALTTADLPATVAPGRLTFSLSGNTLTATSSTSAAISFNYVILRVA